MKSEVRGSPHIKKLRYTTHLQSHLFAMALEDYTFLLTFVVCTVASWWLIVVVFDLPSKFPGPDPPEDAMPPIPEWRWAIESMEKPKVSFDREKGTYRGLRRQYQVRLDNFCTIKAEALADVALTTNDDWKIGGDFITNLEKTQEEHRKEFDTLSHDLATHRDYVDSLMEQLREEKAAHTVDTSRSPLPLIMMYHQVQDAVVTQREMEKGADRLLALGGVTDSHLTTVGTICLKSNIFGGVDESIVYCKKVLERLAHFPDDMVVKQVLYPNPIKGLEVMQANLQSVYAAMRGNSDAFYFGLPEAWTKVWELSAAVREAKGSPDELKSLWMMALEQRQMPNSLAELRSRTTASQPETETNKLATQEEDQGEGNDGGKGEANSNGQQRANKQLKEFKNFPDNKKTAARQVRKMTSRQASAVSEPQGRPVGRLGRKGAHEASPDSYHDRVESGDGISRARSGRLFGRKAREHWAEVKAGGVGGLSQADADYGPLEEARIAREKWAEDKANGADDAPLEEACSAREAWAEVGAEEGDGLGRNEADANDGPSKEFKSTTEARATAEDHLALYYAHFARGEEAMNTLIEKGRLHANSQKEKDGMPKDKKEKRVKGNKNGTSKKAGPKHVSETCIPNTDDARVLGDRFLCTLFQ